VFFYILENFKPSDQIPLDKLCFSFDEFNRNQSNRCKKSKTLDNELTATKKKGGKNENTFH